jgi:hypothetical protein
MAQIPGTAEMLIAGESAGTSNKTSPVTYQYS